MQANFNTITFSLPNVRNEEVLNAIATGILTIIANQFNTGDEMNCVFNRDIAYFSIGEVITDNVWMRAYSNLFINKLCLD